MSDRDVPPKHYQWTTGNMLITRKRCLHYETYKAWPWSPQALKAQIINYCTNCLFCLCLRLEGKSLWNKNETHRIATSVTVQFQHLILHYLFCCAYVTLSWMYSCVLQDADCATLLKSLCTLFCNSRHESCCLEFWQLLS